VLALGANRRAKPIYPALRFVAAVASEFKAINDTVHGTMRLDPLVLDLMETLELQRLNSIRQLGLTYLVFPGANHSRIEHCLGVSHVAGRMADAIGLSPEDRHLVMATGLLHDVGRSRTPWSTCCPPSSRWTTWT